ncbi:MAG: hypothetical protein OHK0012_27820 [Synechococcales cyanobacterium]
MAAFSLERVREHFLFQSLTDAEWESLTVVLRLQRYQPAQVIFTEGDSSRDLLILLNGTVELRRQFVRHPGDYLLATLQPGQLLGEMSLLTGYRRSATAVALAEVEAALLAPSSLEGLGTALQAKLYRACALMMSERLYYLDTMFTDLLEQRGAENAVSTMNALHQRYQSNLDQARS